MIVFAEKKKKKMIIKLIVNSRGKYWVKENGRIDYTRDHSGAPIVNMFSEILKSYYTKEAIRKVYEDNQTNSI